MLTKKSFKPMKYPRKIYFDTQNTLEKNTWTYEIHTQKLFEQTIYQQKKFCPTKYQRWKILDPRNTHEGTVAQWHYTSNYHDVTRPTKFCAMVKIWLNLLFLKKKNVSIFYLRTVFYEPFSNSLPNPIELSEAATKRCSLNIAVPKFPKYQKM